MASKAEALLSDSVKLRTTTTRTEVQDLVAKARVAQAVFESFSQEQVDAIVKGIGKYVYDNAEMLARMAVDETGHRRLRGQDSQEQGQGPRHLEQPQGQEVARHHRRGCRDQHGVRGQADGRGRRGHAGDQSDRHADVQRHVRAQDRQCGDLRAASQGGEVHAST